jgi:hypothetical protein
MRVRMRVAMSGARGGEDWPGVGQILDTSDEEAQALLMAGIAGPVGTSDEDEVGPVVDATTGRPFDPDRAAEGRYTAEAFGQFPDDYVPGDDTGTSVDQRLEPYPAAPEETDVDRAGPMPGTPERPLTRPAPEGDVSTAAMAVPDLEAADLRNISPVSKSDPAAGGPQALPGGADPVTDRPRDTERNDVSPQGPPGTGGGSVADPGETSARRQGARSKAARRRTSDEEGQSPSPEAGQQPGPQTERPSSPSPGPRGPAGEIG